MDIYIISLRFFLHGIHRFCLCIVFHPRGFGFRRVLNANPARNNIRPAYMLYFHTPTSLIGILLIN